jgi:hypothetical protein
MWRIAAVALRGKPGRYRPFEAEILFSGYDEMPQCSTKVDGVWSASGIVHINREADLRSLVASCSGDHSRLIDNLCQSVHELASAAQ